VCLPRSRETRLIKPGPHTQVCPYVVVALFIQRPSTPGKD
jgi:hypothetical protein